MTIRRRHMDGQTILNSRMQTITNTVNCVGVMGKGVALRFKNAHPSNFRDYEARCHRGEVRPGVPYVYAADAKRDKPQLELVLNFPTKNHWRDPSRIEWVRDGLQVIVDNYEEWGITSLALPPLGCGNGGLDWVVVWPLVSEQLGALPIEIEVWVPDWADADVGPETPDAQGTLFE